MTDLISPQPAPENVGNPILQLVIDDLIARSKFGQSKYGQVLRVWNGRDSLVDAYQEQLDLLMYLRQEIERRKEKGPERSFMPTREQWQRAERIEKERDVLLQELARMRADKLRLQTIVDSYQIDTLIPEENHD